MKNKSRFTFILVLLGLCVTFLGACSKTKYTINFVTNGGSQVEQLILEEGEKLIKPSDPVKEGNKFNGWFEDAYLMEKYEFPEKMPAKSFNLYAKWGENDRTLSFDTAGGGTINNVMAPALTKLDMPEDPVKKNRIFAGWFVDEDYEIAFDNVMPINDTTIHAKWLNVEPSTKQTLDTQWISGDSKAYNVVNDNGQTNIAVLEEKDTYSYIGIKIKQNVKAYSTFVMEMSGTNGEEVLLKCQNGGVVAAEKRFVMNGNASQKLVWTVESDNLTDGVSAMDFYVFIRPGQTGGAGTMMTIKSFELYRLREENESYQSVIHFDSLGGTGVESIFADTNSNISEPLDIPTKPGYTFVDWYTSESLETKFIFDKMPQGQTIVYAKWQSNTNVTLSFNSMGGTAIQNIVSAAGADIKSLKPDDPTKPDVLFGGWYLDANFVQAFDFIKMPQEDTVLYARWVVLEENTSITLSNDMQTTQKYIIVQNADGSVTISIDAGKGSYSMFGTKLVLNSKDYSYFKITFTGTNGKPIMFKCQNGGVTAVEQKIVMNGNKQTIYWKVDSKNLPNGTSPMDFYMCLDPGVAHATKPQEDIFVTIESIELLRTINAGSEEQNVIHLITNGGSAENPIFASANATISLPTPTRRGYQFLGWYMDSELTNSFVGSLMPSNNITLHAKWGEMENVTNYVFINENWGQKDGYSNYTTSIVEGKVQIEYNHKDNAWNAGAGATYQIRGLNEDKLHFTKIKMNINLTETTKDEEVTIRIRFFAIDENYAYSGSKTPTLEGKIAAVDKGSDQEVVLMFSSITNSGHFAHLDELIESENFNMLVNIYTKTSKPSYGIGLLKINSMLLC